MDPLKCQSKLSRAEIIAAMMDTFTRRYEASTGVVDAATREAARALAASKFATEAWTARVP